METEHSPFLQKNKANVRFCSVSSVSTELLELHSDKPKLHIIFVPGNPGIVSYYRDFAEALFEQLEGKASVTAIGHISHTREDWEKGRNFSLHDQITHKVEFMKHEFQKLEIPIIMVGHSIGSYICLEILKSFDHQVKFTIGLYPFLTLNSESSKQSIIGLTTKSSFLCTAISSVVALMGLCPGWITNTLVRNTIGKSWSATAINATCHDLLKYHTVRNILYMAETEFEKLSENPDWMFMRRKQHEIALLFGINDHWGPLSLFEEVSKQVPGIALSIEREGHTHSFCCTEAGSVWVARYVADLIKSHQEFKIMTS